MRKSRYCIKAEKRAKPNDLFSKKLIDLLNQPIGRNEDDKLRTRNGRLFDLFKSLDLIDASLLLVRLTDPKANNPKEPLGRLFKCELREELRDRPIEVLKKKI